MPAFKIPWYKRFRGVFKQRLKPYLVDGKYKVIPAFSIGGVDYWMYDSPMEMPAGRFFAGMGIHMELESNCDKEYLLSHTKAMEKILNPLPGKPISLTYAAQININLRERIELLPREDAIYKFASAIFFDKTESLYSYDYKYAEEKIKKWKAAGGTLDFFSMTPLKDLLPVLSMPSRDLKTYLAVREMVETTHRELLTEILSEGDTTN